MTPLSNVSVISVRMSTSARTKHTWMGTGILFLEAMTFLQSLVDLTGSKPSVPKPKEIIIRIPRTTSIVRQDDLDVSAVCVGQNVLCPLSLCKMPPEKDFWDFLVSPRSLLPPGLYQFVVMIFKVARKCKDSRQEVLLIPLNVSPTVV